MTMAVIAPFDSLIGAGFALSHGTPGALERDEAAHAPFIRRSMDAGAGTTSCTGALGRSWARAESGVCVSHVKARSAATVERGFTKTSLIQIRGATE